MTVIATMHKNMDKKTPGFLPTNSSEVGKIKDLSSKSLVQLLELRDRQEKLLKNRVFISKLADQGAKIQALYGKIVKEIESKQQEEQACNLMNKLRLEPIDKNSIQHVEWEGNVEHRKETYLDSDDDSEPEDVLHILSQSIAQEKKIKVIKPDKPLVTADDLLRIGEVPHVKYIVDKIENNPDPKVSAQFKPFKTTKTDVHNPEKEIHRKKHKNWEVTAATPPPILHSPTKALGLEESLKLQQKYNIHLKMIETQHAAEKLFSKTGIKMSQLPENTSKFGKYRETDCDDSEASDSELSEVHDEEPERGGVVFTVMK